MKRTFQLSPVICLSPFVKGGELVAFNVGSDGSVYLLVALEPVDDRREGQGSSFIKTVPDNPQTYRVIGLCGNQCFLDVGIEGERFNIHHVQPLPEGLLLVCARAYYKGPRDFDKNGRVYTRTGKFVREILLGDGINDVQTTTNGTIWTSFSDEGIFGNYGWGLDPVGVSGLMTWDATGKKHYEFKPTGGLHTICDCYAMNVESDEVTWLYYYTEFPLVRLRSRMIHSIWRMPLGGSDAFAISGDHALFRGGYKNRDSYQLFALGDNGNVSLVAEIDLQDERGNKLVAERVVGRANAIHVVSGENLYRVDVQTAIAA